jgi:RNA polymerase sigma factor (sigma-70 family)
MEDSQLMARIAAGEHAAMDEFNTQYRDVLLKFLFKRVSQEVAEDLSQIVLLKVWTKASTFRAGAQITSWLFSIAGRTLIDHFRKERRSLPTCELEFDFEARESSYLSEDDRESVRTIVAKLVGTFSFGASVVDDFLNERSHAEASALRGVTESTSRWRRTQMMQCLANSPELANVFL